MGKKDLSRARVALVNAHVDVPLKTHVSIDGAVYGAVRVREMRAIEVGAYIESLVGWAGRSEDEKGRAPSLEMFALVPLDGGDPIEGLTVVDLEHALTDADLMAVDKAAVDFLPSRLRAESAPTPATGDGTSDASQPGSAPTSDQPSGSGGENSSNTSGTQETTSEPASAP